MKSTNLKFIAIALSALMLMQSCVVYHKAPVTVDEALSFDNKVRAKTFVDVTYDFKNLIREEGQLYGITKRGSKTAKLLSQQIVDNYFDSKYVKIVVLENTIKSYHLKNKNASTLANVFLTITLVGLSTYLFFESASNWYGI